MMKNSQSEPAPLVLTRRLEDGTVEWIPIEIPRRMPVEPGADYTLIDRGEYEAPQALLARRQGDDLVVEVEQTEVLVLEDFFATPAVAFYPTTDIASGAGPFSATPVTPESPVLASAPQGEQVVWAPEQPEADARADAGEPGEKDGDGSPLIWGLAGGGLLLAAAAGAGGGGGGGSGGGGVGVGDGPPGDDGGGDDGSGDDGSGDNGSGGNDDGDGDGDDDDHGGGDGPPVQTIIEGMVVVGRVISGNGLSVEVAEADGISLLDEAKVAADGNFSIDTGDYDGVIVARTVDADAGADYADEASGADRDLNATLSAVRNVGGSDETVQVNLNPLTTLAAGLAAREADGGAPTAEQVARANAAVAELFALPDLHTVAVEPINGGAYDAGDGLSAGERYGAMLAAFSGADLNNGGNTQQTLDDVLAGLTLSASGEAELSEAAQAILIEGAATTERETGEPLSELVSSALDTFAPEITSGDTATPIDENSGADQAVYTAAATDAGSVTWSLEGSGDAADFTIDAATGAVKLAEDPDHERKSSYEFTVVATDDEGNSSRQTVSLEINDLDEVPPTITSGDAAAPIDENSGAGQVVYAVTSTDDGDISTGDTTYSLSPVDDAEDFTIDPETGEVTLTENPDFEAKLSYSFTVVATDATGNSSEQAVTLAINDVDETPASVSRVALTDAVGAESGILNAGDTVSVTVTMSEVITVDTTGGTPRIALAIGSTTAYADYVSGSGSTSLIFQYTIQPDDGDSNGISIPPNSLEENGGSLTDANGNAADLGHGPVTNDPSFIVDTTAPSLSSTTPEDDADDVPVDVNIVLTFSEDVRVGSGTIVLSDGSDTRIIDVTDDTQVSVNGNVVTIDPASDLEGEREYALRIDTGAFVDVAGNAYAGIGDGTTLNFGTEDGDDDDDALGVDASVVVFDLVEGASSDHSDRTFDGDVSYDIYIRVESDDAELDTDGDDEGTWGTWSGASNLGSDDRVILVGNGHEVQGRLLTVNNIAADPTAVAWRTLLGESAALLEGSGVTRSYRGESDTAALFDAPVPEAFLAGQGGAMDTMYLTDMPAGILTSQGLV